MYLHTLGGLRLEGSEFQRTKPLLFLTYLTLEGPKERYALARLFWPGMETALDNVTTTLARLRRAAPELLEFNQTYARSLIHSDIQDFEAALRDKNWEQVIASYQGPFLQGISLEVDNVELEEWVYQKREYLATNVRSALLHVAQQEASLGHFDKAAHHALKATEVIHAPELELDEFEILYKILRTNNHPKAKDISREAKEFGLELYLSESEARQALLKPQSTPSTLPLQGTVFIGRETEKTLIAKQLSQCRLLTLIGPGGIGKTRLSLAVAEAQQSLFSDGVFFVALDIVPSANLIIFTLADVLGIQLTGVNPKDQVLNYLQSKHMLLILDNLEHLVDDLSIIQDVLASAPHVKILATSRESLGLQSEYLFDVQGLSLPEPAMIETTEAVQLFAERAHHQQIDFVLDHTTLPTVATICRILDGMPLAIELAASWLRILDLDDLLKELTSGLHLLSANVKDLAPRHHSIQKVFEASWERLSTTEQDALRSLAIFQGGFSKEAAKDIAQLDLQILLKLLNKSFLRRDTPKRFSQHPLIFYYVQGKLKEAPEKLRLLEHKHSLYYLQNLRDNAGNLRNTKAKTTRETLSAELPNIRAAWFYLTHQDHVEAIPVFGEALSHFFDSHHDHEAIELFKQTSSLLQSTNKNHHAALGYMLILQAKHSLNLGADVISLFEMTQHALNLLKPLKAYSGIITATLILGYIAREQGDFKKATNLFKEALKLARQHSTPQDVGQCLNWLCSTQKNIDSVSNTTKLMRESIEELKQLGDPINLGFGLFIFGSFLTQNHQFEEAERLLKESLELEQQTHFFAIPVQIELARLALQHQDLDKAQVLLKQGFEKASKIGDEFSKQNALSMLGKIKLKQGQLQEAEELLTQSLKGSWEKKMLLATSRALIYIAELGFALEHSYYSLVLLSFLNDYPAITKQDKEETKKLLTVKTASLSTSEILRVKKQAKTLGIEDVVYSVLGENKFKFAIGD